MNFTDIEFGKATGEQESLSFPILLEKGFINKDNALEKLKSSDKFLILGFKGSGKSILGEKIKHESFPENKDSKFCTTVNHLADFPFKSFAKIFSGDAEPESKYPTTWQYLILTTLLEAFVEDPNGRDTENLEFRESISKLNEHGLLPIKNLKSLALRSSKTSFKVNLFKLLEYNQENSQNPKEQDILFLEVVDYLKELIPEFNTQSKHLLIIDGLDDILTLRDIQLKSLGALIFEAQRLNIWMQREKIPAKIIILCRTDLFEKLPVPNKNKIRQDYSVSLDWYHDPRDASNSMLVELANLRASLFLDGTSNIFDSFFEKETENKPTTHFLLDHTRHTPRDFTQLLNNIKSFYKNEKISRNEIINGIRKYSTEYFLPEIKDELVGYIDDIVFDNFTQAVTQLKQREFKYTALIENIDLQKTPRDSVDSLLNALFKCSAIGNKWSHSGNERYEFIFRNPHAQFDKTKTIVLHKGLWKSLNLI
ncbi:hypothetical protein [Pseudomonas sp. WS 5011]|uniref:P-loop ATPase, Sll1717 family n=1 Tax=Pseudomonas sp. WS 5011 TaxID=2717477 RepID=UPI0014751915|nr:hypothetical protein [Pseudomonas sp. WS 5011]NMY51060.1 hypothetical protein [Pseudomonas sp. WS 5011]